MKKIFLSAAALSMLFVSCSNDETTIQKEEQHVAYRAKQQTELTAVITEVYDNCHSINEQDNKLITTVEAVAMETLSFKALVDSSYTTPTLAELNAVDQNPQLQIAQMSYRTKVKEQLELLLDENVAISYLGNTDYSKDEQELLETCRLLTDSGNGNGGNWGNNDAKNKTAFAQGYQTSRAKAVIMVVLAGRK